MTLRAKIKKNRIHIKSFDIIFIDVMQRTHIFKQKGFAHKTDNVERRLIVREK